MSKRRAGNELTKDNWDKEEEKVEAGQFKVADESIMKNRVVKKAKRTLQRDESGELKPIFSGFSGFKTSTNSSNSKQAFSFLSKCNEIPSESGNHPSASTINSMTTSTSLSVSEKTCAKSQSQSIINPVKVMKLNEAFVKFITNAVQKNPYCVLTPTLKDYEKQVSKFVTLTGSTTNISDSLATSSKDCPQISSFENTVKRIKDSDEVKNNSVDTETKSTSFINPINNNPNNGQVFNFGTSNPVIKTNETNTNNSKLGKADEKTEKEENLESKSQSEESKNTSTANSGFKLGDFKFNQQSFTNQFPSTPLTSKSSESVFNEKKTSPLSSKPLGIPTFNATPSFNFGSTTIPAFSFKPMEKTDKPFFSFGSKPSTSTPVSVMSNSIEAQKSKDEEDEEDQPPVVNFTPIKENDAIFESKSKLYYLKDGKYEEHGIGQLYLKPIDDKKVQLLMRNDSALGTIMINTILNESVNFTKRNAKNVQLICVPDPTKSVKLQTILFKFKDSQITDSFESELSKLKT